MSRLRHGLSIWAPLVILVCGLGVVDLTTELGTDYGAYFSHGWFITKGLVPYGDFWTHKTPLLPMVLAGWIGLTGTGFYSAAVFPLAVTLATAPLVYLLAVALRVSRSPALGASWLFAFFAASHVLDPTRNGVIVIAASAFETLALFLAIRGVKTGRRWNHAAAGIMVALALATRQTAVIVSLPVAVAVVLARGRSQLARAAVDVAVIAAAALVSVVGLTAYFMLNHVSIETIWDQVYRFNVIYATGYQTKLTWWGAGWLLVVWNRGLLVLMIGAVLFAWGRLRTVWRREPLSVSSQVLIVLAGAHLAAIYLSQKVQPIYLYQLMPELCIMTAVTAHEALRVVEQTRWGTIRRASVIAASVALLAWPVGLEVVNWRTTVGRARVGGYFLDPTNLPSQVLARRIQQLAPDTADRIWVFSASADALYPFSNRLPALRMTSVAGLVYETSPDAFERWRAQFASHVPRVVLSFYGDEYVRRWEGHPQASNGRTVATILEIRRYLITTMRRLDGNGQLPEVFVPLGAD